MIDGFLEFAASKAAWILAALILLFVAERLFPVVHWKGGYVRVLKNFCLAALNVLAGPLIVIPVTVYAVAHGVQWRPVMWSGWGGLLLDVLLLDFWIYWWHRANHVLPLLWRFHEVHHLDEMLDSSSAVRFHVGEVVLSAFARAIVVVLLAMPLGSVVVFEVMVALAAIFHHSNVRLPKRLEKLLARIVVTPSVHWVHHHARRSDTDSNYGTILSIWDPIFASRSKTARHADMPLGVEGSKDQGLIGLLVRPFSKP